VTPVSDAGSIPEAGTPTRRGSIGGGDAAAADGGLHGKVAMLLGAKAVPRPQKNNSMPALSKYLYAMDHKEANAVTPGGKCLESVRQSGAGMPHSFVDSPYLTHPMIIRVHAHTHTHV